MKQHHLSTKFLVFYIFIGVFGFFLVTLGGSYMVERHFEHSLSAALYTEAHNIASNEAVKNNISSATVDSLQEHLSAIAHFQDEVLWIINNNGEIIVSTRKNIAIDEPIPFDEFDAAKWGSNYYQVGKFYGYFPYLLCSYQSPGLGLQSLYPQTSHENHERCQRICRW